MESMDSRKEGNATLYGGGSGGYGASNFNS